MRASRGRAVEVTVHARIHEEVGALAQDVRDLVGGDLVRGAVNGFRELLPSLLDPAVEADDDIVIAVDAGWRESANRHRAADYASCSMGNIRQSYYGDVDLLRVAEDLPEQEINGEWMGLVRVSATARARLRQLVDEIVSSPDRSGRVKTLPDLLNIMVERGETVRVIYSTGHWLDIDSLKDVVTSSSFA